MNILVTGGAGFIGSHLTECLVYQGHNVTVVDNLSTGYLSNLNLVINNILFVQEDLENCNMSNFKDINVVVHLAAQTSVPLSVAHFKKSSDTNLLGNINVIDFCCQSNIPLVYASSSAIYGNLALGDDQSKSIDLISPYAVDKYTMELYAHMANKIYNLSSVGLRFFNVFGPRQDPSNPYSGVISIFIDKLIKDKGVIVNGGYQTRDFIYVLDVVTAIERSINLVCSVKTFDTVNVLTGKTCTIDYLLQTLASILDKNPVIDRKALEIGDPERSDGTIRKMETILNLSVKDMTDFRGGLVNIINTYINE